MQGPANGVPRLMMAGFPLPDLLSLWNKLSLVIDVHHQVYAIIMSSTAVVTSITACLTLRMHILGT